MSNVTPTVDVAAPGLSRTDAPSAPRSALPGAAPVAERLQSLDAYRGLIMVTLAFHGFGLKDAALNHLKTSPDSGFWKTVYHHFEHVEWVGGGFWDLIQPSFMFMVGVSMAYSYVNRQRAGESWSRMFGHACRRGLILILLGIFLISNGRPSTNWLLTNVLTQMGLGYPFLFLLWRRSFRTQAIVAAALLLGTWALYAFGSSGGIDLAKGAPEVGVPAAWAQEHLVGVGPAWHKNANVGQTIDMWLLNLLPRRDAFTFHVGGYQSINFIPSLATMLFGLMCGELLRSSRTAQRKLLLLVAAGIGGIGAGLLWGQLGVPIVKRIWTPSWALYSTGWCCLILATLFAIIDIKKWRAWSFPLLVVGMNSIAIYCMHMLLTSWTGKMLQTHLGPNAFKIFGPMEAPIVQATLVGLVFWLVCWWMYRRKIFLRI
jgi:heparan-alpha-glucosaminide N-acetyltransferase